MLKKIWKALEPELLELGDLPKRLPGNELMHQPVWVLGLGQEPSLLTHTTEVPGPPLCPVMRV